MSICASRARKVSSATPTTMMMDVPPREMPVSESAEDTALMMIGVRLIQAISNYLQIFVMAKVASDTVRDIKTDVFDAMSRLSLNFFVNKQTGGLMTRVLSDSERVREFFIDGLPMLFVHGITIIATFTVMYRLNWKMALIACILLPLLVYMTVKLRPGLWTLSGKRHRAEKP